MHTEIHNAADAETQRDTVADIALENFEIEDISDLNLYGPLSIPFSMWSCSSCQS